MIEEVPYHTHNGIDSPKLASTAPEARTVIPKSVLPFDPSASDQTAGFAPADNVKAYCGQVIVPAGITASKFTVRFTNSQASANIKFGLYSEDGQTRYFTATVDTTSTGGVPVTTSVTRFFIPAGIYYIAYVSDQAVPTHQVAAWATSGTVASTYEIYDNATGLPRVEGYVATSSFTLPITFDPTALTAQHGITAHFRLDN